MKKKEKDLTEKSCWKGYKKVGTKIKNDKVVNNCVPKKAEN